MRGDERVAGSIREDFYFAKSYVLWWRGTNENGSGLVRTNLPKGTDFASVSDEQLREIERRIKRRP